MSADGTSEAVIMRDGMSPAPASSRTLPPTARAALTRALDRPGVAQAAIIGSYARGEQHAGSDLDIAVWLQEEISGRAALELCSMLLDDAQRAVDGLTVDLVDLRRAPPVLRHRAIRDADVLLERDHETRVRQDRDALLTYWDTAPLREMQRLALRQRIEEGRFGRR